MFRYQVSGLGAMLQVRREAMHEIKPLWIIREDQGDEWREGRILLPSYDMAYQVSFWFKIQVDISAVLSFHALQQNPFHSSLENVVEQGLFFFIVFFHVAIVTK